MVPRGLQLHPNTLKRLLRLTKEAERDGSYRVAKRLQSVVLNADGHSSGEIAKILKAPRSRTSEWLRVYEEHGVEGLLEGHRSDRVDLLGWMKRNGTNWRTFSIAVQRPTGWTPESGHRR